MSAEDNEVLLLPLGKTNYSFAFLFGLVSSFANQRGRFDKYGAKQEYIVILAVPWQKWNR